VAFVFGITRSTRSEERGHEMIVGALLFNGMEDLRRSKPRQICN
jgi:hypothetical protein